MRSDLLAPPSLRGTLPKARAWNQAVRSVETVSAVTAAGHAPWLWAHSSPMHWPVLAIAVATNTLTAALVSGPVGPVAPVGSGGAGRPGTGGAPPKLHLSACIALRIPPGGVGGGKGPGRRGPGAPAAPLGGL